MKEYTDIMVLEKLKDYFKYKFKLDENKGDVTILSDEGFWFSARTKSTMEKIGVIELSEILKSCNLVDSTDNTFYDEQDLLNELNSLVPNKDIVEYMITFLDEVYDIKVLK